MPIASYDGWKTTQIHLKNGRVRVAVFVTSKLASIYQERDGTYTGTVLEQVIVSHGTHYNVVVQAIKQELLSIRAYLNIHYKSLIEED